MASSGDEEDAPVDATAFKKSMSRYAFRAPAPSSSSSSPASASKSKSTPTTMRRRIRLDTPPSPVRSGSASASVSPSSSSSRIGSPLFALELDTSPQDSLSSSSSDDDDASRKEQQSKSKAKKKKKPARPYADPSVYAHLRGLTDYLVPDLAIMMCGINPGIKSATDGHHYASPTNYFYRCMHGSGFTPRRLHPSEDYTMPTYGIGSTNLVPRPSAEMSELSKQEMLECVPALLAKVIKYRPKVVNFIGMGIADMVFRWIDQHCPAVLEPIQVDGNTSSEDEDEAETRKRGKRGKASSASASPSKRKKGAPTKRKKLRKIKIGLQDVYLSYPGTLVDPLADSDSDDDGADENENERDVVPDSDPDDLLVDGSDGRDRNPVIKRERDAKVDVKPFVKLERDVKDVKPKRDMEDVKPNLRSRSAHDDRLEPDPATDDDEDDFDPDVLLRPTPAPAATPDAAAPEPVPRKAERARTLFYVVPSTSARVVAYQLNDQIALWKDLKAFVDCVNADGGTDSLDLSERFSDGSMDEIPYERLTVQVERMLPRAAQVLEEAAERVRIKKEEQDQH